MRRKAGHCLFGLRTTHGETLFFTISPDRRHSTLLLKLSRARQNDTSLRAQGDTALWRRRLAGADVPSLTVPPGTAPEEVEKVLELPPLAIRKKIYAQDPLSAIQRYDVATRVLLGRIAGTRFCPRCPDCNTFEAESAGNLGCSNKFSNNAMPCGGSAGFSDQIGAMTEHQGDGTPHVHGSMVLVSVYQFSTLEEIAERIEQDWLSVEAIKEYQMHICREEHYAHDQHKEQEPALERAWKENYTEPELQGLCALPAIFTDVTPTSLWGKGEASFD